MRPALRPLIVAALLAASARAAGAQSAPAPDGRGPAIVAELQASAQEWNRGNLDGFLLPYLDSPTTTYVGRSGIVRGKRAIREKYVTNYFHPGGALPDLLSFADMEVRGLGRDYALALGRWIITDRRTHRQTSTGRFSLTFQRTPQGWRIIHDHSS
jgi:ketosteroid isomerase-like protein